MKIMNTQNPKISVIMSVYNGSRYLREAIESILNQTFTNFEFIIINDCSTDNSWEILTEYSNKDRRIRLFNNEENIGLTKSLNKGINLARGEYIARQDADDVSLPQRFDKQVALLDSYPDVVLVSCDIEVINSEGYFVKKEQRSCDPQWISWYMLFYNHIGGHSQVIFRRKTAMGLGGYSESYRYSQDYEFWCRIVRVGNIVILPEILHKLRRHNKGITAEKRSEQLDYALNISRNNLKQLIGKELSINEVSDLRRFWSGHISRDFPDSEKVNAIHARQQELYQAFIQNISNKKFVDRQIPEQLRILIGLQFLYWLQSLNIIYHLPSRLKISFYALKWHSLIGVIYFWLKDIYKQPLAILLKAARYSIRTLHKVTLLQNS